MKEIALKAYDAYLKKNIIWMKTIHYQNKISFHNCTTIVPQSTIVPMSPFTPKSTSTLRPALHFRYSLVIQRFIRCANTAQS